jgi:hypothetical protein
MKKKMLTLFLVISLSTTTLFGGDKERNNIGSAAEGGSFSATAMSMLGWGAGLAVVAGGLAALFSSSSSSGSCGH